FQRGVVLYSEADYHAALVEFKRAYGLAPNVAVLYNVGETEYQLQDYAAALTTFKRYLAESSPTESHRAEVENSVEVLRTRVGHLSIATTPPGAEVTLDDQLVGKTPLGEPILVSIGHRKVVAMMSGRPPVTRYVDVAADDNVSLSLPLPTPSDGAQASVRSPQLTLPSDVPPVSRGGGSTARVLGWVATGALAAGAVTFGLLANKEAGNLTTARGTFPTTLATLNHDANLTTTYSVIADSLTAAAVVIGGITLFSTVSSLSSNGATRDSSNGGRVMLGLGSARFETTF
ncbi:MAG TPA: PEGA domain-containing protein, partial [Polyangiaceae bacterium]|nr:PEGA domain-containing protein [Polyangiaceae bacterium]